MGVKLDNEYANCVAAVTAAKASLLPSATVLGVTGTLGFGVPVEMTISSTTFAGDRPSFTAAALADADFLWLAPNGVWFCAKAPTQQNFTDGGTGKYLIFCMDWSGVTEFYCANCNVTALKVGVATALTELDCSVNDVITELDVSANVLLETLDFGYNQIAEIDLTNLTALTWCDAVSNQLTELDVSENVLLTYLGCHINPALSAINISANTLLEEFACGGTAISTLDISSNEALISISSEDAALTESAVDAILAELVSRGSVSVGTNGVYLGGTNSPPSNPAGLALVTQLRALHWTVEVAS